MSIAANVKGIIKIRKTSHFARIFEELALHRGDILAFEIIERNLMMRPRIAVYSHRGDLLQLYNAVFTDEDYEVTLSAPNIKNILSLEQDAPNLILVDITEEEDPIDPFFLRWLREHPLIPQLFCIDKYLQNTEVQRFLREQKVPQIDKPFDIDLLIKTANRCLQSKIAIG